MKIISSCVHSLFFTVCELLRQNFLNPNWISKWSSRIEYCDLNTFINTCVMSSRKNDQDSLKSNQFKNFSEKKFKNHSTIHNQFNHQQQFLKSFIFVLVTSFGLALLGGQCTWPNLLGQQAHSPACHWRAHRALYQNSKQSKLMERKKLT